MDSNDNLYITGRLKNIVIVSGQNIHIEEVEEVLKGFTFVDNAVVYGEPNELTGERLCAKVILRKNTIISQSEMKNYLRNELPEYKVPKKIEFVRRLDINIGGKINRKNEKKSCQDKEEHN